MTTQENHRAGSSKTSAPSRKRMRGCARCCCAPRKRSPAPTSCCSRSRRPWHDRAPAPGRPPPPPGPLRIGPDPTDAAGSRRRPLMTRWMPLLGLLAVLGTGGEYTFNKNSTGTGSGTGTGTGTGNNPTGPSPTPSPTPTPTPTGTFRTPDPAPGTFLPLPPYGPQVYTLVDRALNPITCENFSFIDALSEALRARDTRWGYLCRGVGCTSGARDKLIFPP